MKRLIPALVLCVLGAASWSAAADDAAPGYVMRYADVGGGHVVFTYEDDLWLVPVAGGEARRITNDPGTEQYAKISPDGTHAGVHRRVRRQPRRLRHAGRGRRAEAPDLPPRLRPGPGLVPRRQGRAVPGQPGGARGRVRGVARPLAGGMPTMLPLDEAALVGMAPDGQRGGLQPHRPRGPHLEAVRGRHGPGRVGGHLQDRRDQEDHRLARHRPVPHVDGLDHLLQQRPRGRHAEHLRLRHRQREDHAPDAPSRTTT